ncbi:MAG: hypothetical protein ACPIOQ_79430, partial [Promethearchaeia archaeon]
SSKHLPGDSTSAVRALGLHHHGASTQGASFSQTPCVQQHARYYARVCNTRANKVPTPNAVRTVIEGEIARNGRVLSTQPALWQERARESF